MFAILSLETASADPFDEIPEIPENKAATTDIFFPPYVVAKAKPLSFESKAPSKLIFLIY
jgi:hypothetical protein